MKTRVNKKGIFAIIAAALFLMAGCQSQPEEGSFFKDDLPMDRRIGEIRSLGGVKTESQGTHILQLDNGDTVLLKSLAINLDDEKYKGKVVEVRGVLTYTKDSKSLMEVMNIDILEKYEAEEAVKAKWLTYNGSGDAYSIKYRDDFRIRESAGGVTFEMPADEEEAEAAADAEITAEDTEEDEAEVIADDDMIEAAHLVIIETEQKEADEDLVTFLELDGDSSEDLLKAGLTVSRIGADGLMAYKKETMDGAGLTFYAETNDVFYTISFEAGTDSNYLEAKNLFYEMLGTFDVNNKVLADDENSSEDDTANNDSDSDENDSLSFEDEEDDDFDNEDAGMENTGDDGSGENDESTGEQDDDMDVAEGFNVFENETFEFSIQYPKNWYYSGSASTDSGVVRRYEFGDEPIEEESGNVYLDIISGDIPSGQTSGKITVVENGGGVEIYIEGDSRNFRLSGPDSIKSTLMDMAETLE